MIDLHMHTTYSDGTDSVINVLKQAQRVGLEYISITDHNTIDGYKELENTNIKDYYNGQIIVGCEITTSYKSTAIEVIAYDFDYKKLEVWLNKWFSKEAIQNEKMSTFIKLKNKCLDVGLTLNKDLELPGNAWPSIAIIDELKKYPPNFEYFDKDIWEAPGFFYRKHLSNPNSPFFIDESETKPKLDEILENVHNAGGKVFFAHLYGYHMDNYEDFLDSIVNDYKLDGIECYYTTFGQARTKYLVDFCKQYNLLMSGGSDYHGNMKPQVKLGIGEGELKVPLQDWLKSTSFKF